MVTSDHNRSFPCLVVQSCLQLPSMSPSARSQSSVRPRRTVLAPADLPAARVAPRSRPDHPPHPAPPLSAGCRHNRSAIMVAAPTTCPRSRRRQRKAPSRAHASSSNHISVTNAIIANSPPPPPVRQLPQAPTSSGIVARRPDAAGIVASPVSGRFGASGIVSSPVTTGIPGNPIKGLEPDASARL